MHIQVFLKEKGYGSSGISSNELTSKGGCKAEEISNDILCGIDKDMKIIEKYQSYGDILFHEFGHALHHLEGVYCEKHDKHLALECIYDTDKYNALWTNDEELYNITGIFYNGSNLDFDPINCNLFDICNSCKLNKQIIQRIFHMRYYWINKQTLKAYCIETYYRDINILDKIDNFLIDVSKYVN